MVIELAGHGTCPCTGTTSDVWCMFRSMSDIWRDMMEEQLITEVNGMSFMKRVTDFHNYSLKW